MLDLSPIASRGAFFCGVNTMVKADKDLVVSGSCCPVPLIQIAKAMATMKEGETLCVLGDDPIFELGVRDFCEANGHTLLDVEVLDKFARKILIRCSGESDE